MGPPPSVPARALAAASAGLLAFALVPAISWLGGGHLFEGWTLIACFAAVPATAIALMPFSARIFCFGLSLLAVVGTWLLDPRGPDNPMIVLPVIAWCLAAAAIVAELCIRAAGRLRASQSPIEGDS